MGRRQTIGPTRRLVCAQRFDIIEAMTVTAGAGIS
jgi:hypothetical protein